MARSKGLGRGLSALIGENSSAGAMAPHPGPAGPEEIRADEIIPNHGQPRTEFNREELEELADSIRQYGIIQPIVVRRSSSAGYELVAGERRWRAAKMAGLSVVPAWVRDASDEDMMALALVENVQREDLNPVEEAKAYAVLSESMGWSQDEIAHRVGKSRSHVANYFRILQLNEGILEWIRSKALTMAHAKVLLSVDDEILRSQLAADAVEYGWTVRELDERRQRAGTSVSSSPSPTRGPDVHMRAVEEGLRRALGAGVTVRGDGNRGRIEIRYRSLDELERLIEVLGTAEGSVESFPV